MKKLFFVLLSAFLLSSCSSEKDKLLKQGETFLKSQLKDPSSYQLIQSSIIDTITVEQQWKNSLLRNQKEILKSKSNYSRDSLKYVSDMKEYKDSSLSKSERDLLCDRAICDFRQKKTDLDIIKSNQWAIDEFGRLLSNPTKKDIETEGSPKDICSIILSYNYRAKNSFGAFGVETSEIIYNPLDKIDKFRINN